MKKLIWLATLLPICVFAQDDCNGFNECRDDINANTAAISGLEADVGTLQSDVGTLQSDLAARQDSDSQASLNGIALHPDKGAILGYLTDGTAFGKVAGDTFSFAAIQLPHSTEIQGLSCVLRDNDILGYIQINLIRGPINTADPVIPVQTIAGVRTLPEDVDPNLQLLSDSADPTRNLVDNRNFGYFFRVDFLDVTADPFNQGAVALRGCTVELDAF
jgi:hypothetical protein